MKLVILIFCTLTLLAACKSSQIQSQTELTTKRTARQESKLKHDPIEDAPKYKHIFETIDVEVNEILKDDPHRNHIGFCYTFWETKKRLLKEKYGIDWKSPAQMNPHVIFD